MTITEVFPNPTVKKVIFEIKFSNLFFIENKIGEFQSKIIRLFPESSLVIRKKLIFADVGPESKIDSFTDDAPFSGEKIWQFKSNNKMTLNVTTSSIDISSEAHKSFNLSTSDADNFFDVIKVVIEEFFTITQLAKISRIGLRYINECPIISKDNDTIREWYKTTFPLNRFNISEASEMLTKAVVNRNDYNLIFHEVLVNDNGNYKLILDYDSYAENIESRNYADILKILHEAILTEFDNSINSPLIDHMRREPEA